MPKPKKERPPVRVSFQAARLVGDLGGPGPVAELAAMGGVTGITRDAATKWAARNAMPLNAVASLHHAAAAVGRPFDFTAYVNAERIAA